MKDFKKTKEQLIKELEGLRRRVAILEALKEEYKRSEQDLVRLATAIEQTAESIVITATDGIIQYVNPAFEQISKYTREEVVGKHISIIGSGSHDKVYRRMLWESLSRGEVWTDSFMNRKKDGTLYEVETTISPIKDSSGAIINYVSVQRDVTRERELEKQLRQAQKLEAIGTLAGGIAHDFNNIIMAIYGYTEIVINEVSEETKIYDDLQGVLRAADRAKELVKQILAFSRTSEKEQKPVQISLIIKEAIKLLRASLPTTIEIRQNIETTKGAVLSDPTQIHQVLINLCTNAAHAMQKKGGTLNISLSEVEITPEFVIQKAEFNPGLYLKLRVSDTGHGMTPAIMERIFDPYFTTKPKGEGTGLGLAVVHGIVKSLGGVIKAQSTPGKGSTFDVFLPKIEGDVIQELKVVTPLPRGNERILLVDDEKAIVEIAQRMLENLGYKVVARTSSVDALDAFKAQPDKFDLVITDQTMPGLTGVELSKKLMRIRPDIPIILCTGFSELVTPERAKAVGIKEYIMKPIVISKLSRSIRKLLDKD